MTSNNTQRNIFLVTLGAAAAYFALSYLPMQPDENPSANQAIPIKQIKSAEKAPSYSRPDRVNLTSGRHIGGENSGIEKIILHITDSEGRSAENWFHHPNPPEGQAVSAHYIVENDGTIVQIVPDNTVAYHCKGQNQGSIGIEFVGKLDNTNTQTLTPAQINRGISLILYLQKKHKISNENIYGHRDFSSKQCPGKENLRVIKDELKKYAK